MAKILLLAFALLAVGSAVAPFSAEAAGVRMDDNGAP
jgi:hypothetical protein